MTFEEYRTKVRWMLQDSTYFEGKQGAAAKDVLEDLDREGAPPYIEDVFKDNYSVPDAVRSIILTSDVWDEDWAIAQQQELTTRYA